MNSPVRICIPSKGRLKAPTLTLFEGIGATPLGGERDYIQEAKDPRFQFIFTRASDIPLYVQYGAADLGVTGHDLIMERGSDVYELVDLGYGGCILVLAVPSDSGIQRGVDLPSGARVATEYPNLAKEFFSRIGRQVEILVVSGAAELAPRVGLASAIIDITTTGETLRRNGLRIVEEIMRSTAVMACNRISYKTKRELIGELLSKVEAAIKGG
ncbi:MAG: ATP phosphoribosyltransferase [Candidatus Bathyarchaeia archaeon]